MTEAHRRSWWSEYNIYRVTMFYSLIAAVLIIAGLPRPVFLVLVSSALAFFIAPVIFFLNIYYCVTVIPKDEKGFYPSQPVIWFSWFSLAVFTALTIVVILARVFGGDPVRRVGLRRTEWASGGAGRRRRLSRPVRQSSPKRDRRIAPRLPMGAQPALQEYAPCLVAGSWCRRRRNG